MKNIAGFPSRLMQFALRSTAMACAEAMPADSVYDLGQKFLRRSGLGLGRFPHAFDPNESEYFLLEQDEFRAYFRALRATDSVGIDNFSKRCRFFLLEQVTDWAVRNAPANAEVAECGCGGGTSTYFIADIIHQTGVRRFSVFDSFEGLSEIAEQDRGLWMPDDPEDISKVRERFRFAEGTVRSRLSPFEFVDFYRGWIPQRFAEVADRQFCFVHVDVDLYDPIRDSIDFFYPRLLNNGVMVFDDYGSSGFPGARRAVDELAKIHKPRIFLKFPLGGACWIK